MHEYFLKWVNMLQGDGRRKSKKRGFWANSVIIKRTLQSNKHLNRCKKMYFIESSKVSSHKLHSSVNT